MSHAIYQLHLIIFYICCAIGIAVFGILIYSIIRFRRSKGAKAQDVHEHLGIEILWAVIPFILLVVMVVPATKVLMGIHHTDESALLSTPQKQG